MATNFLDSTIIIVKDENKQIRGREGPFKKDGLKTLVKLVEGAFTSY